MQCLYTQGFLGQKRGCRVNLLIGGVYEFSVPEIFPESVFGYEFFNFFFSLPIIFAVLIIVPLVLIQLINRS